MAGGSTEGPIEAGALTGVAGALSLLLDDEQQRVAVAVVVGLAHELAVARRVALAPHLLTAARPEHRAALGEALAQRLGVHPLHHQHLARAVLLDDRGNEIGRASGRA